MGVSRSRWLLASTVLGALVLLGAPAAYAQVDGSGTRTGDEGPRVVLTGGLELAEGERSEDVVVFDGDTIVDGDVDGAVVAFNGDVVVRGNVSEDVVVFNGRAEVEPGASVDGDVLSSRSPRVAEGATVTGETRRVRFTNYFNALGWLLWFAWWVAVTVSTWILGLLFLVLAPRAGRAVVAVAQDRVGPAVGWGLLVAVGLPVVSVLLLLTLVALPLGLIGLLSLALVYALGLVAASLVLGRRLVGEPRSAVLAFTAGWAILRVVDLIPVLGDLITAAATIFGVGALAVAGWRAARGAASTPAPGPGPTPATTAPSF